MGTVGLSVRPVVRHLALLVMPAALALISASCLQEDSTGNGSVGTAPDESIVLTESALLTGDTFTGLGGNEPHIAVNPIDPQVVAVSQCLNVALSFDGGKTFPSKALLTTPAGFTRVGCDDVLAFDSKGRLFVTILIFVPGASPEPDIFVQQIDARRLGPGVNDVSRLVDASGLDCSTAGANAAQCPIDVSNLLGLDGCHDGGSGRSADRQWLAADIHPKCSTPIPSRQTRTCSPFQDTLYLVWTDSRCGNTGSPQTARVASSSDQGATWTTQALTDPLNPTQVLFNYGVGIAANGDAYVAGNQAGLGQTVVFQSQTGTALGFAGNATYPFPAPLTRLTANSQQCSCGPGVCRSNNAIACTLTATTCPGNPPAGDGGVGCECPANDCIPPPSCMNVPIPGWQLCGNRSTTTHVFAAGTLSPSVVTDQTNPNNVAIFSSVDPNPGAVAVDKFDVKYVIAKNAASGIPTWATPISVTPSGGALPPTNQIFPTAASTLPGVNGSCVTLAYYDDRNPSPANANGSKLLDVFVTVHPNLWSTSSVWQPEVRVNDVAFDPDLGAPDRVGYCNPSGLGCEPPNWIPTSRIGEYFGILQGYGAAWTGNTASTPGQAIFFDYSDGIPPVVVPPPAKTLSTCTPAVGALGMATATDVCGVPPVAPLSLTPIPSPARLSPGLNTVTWTSTDGANNAGTATQAVTVNDTTAPSVVAPPSAYVTICNPTGGTVIVGLPTAVDDCNRPVTITGRVIRKNGVTLGTPIDVVNGQVTLAFGTYVIQWTASDGTNTSASALQTVTVGPKIQAAGSFILDDNSFIKTSSGGGGQIFNSGSTRTRLGVSATSASITSVASVQLSNNAKVTGNVISGGTITASSGQVTGTRTQNASVILPALPPLPAFPAPAGADIFVNGSTTLTPGSYPSVYINTGGTLILTGGDFFFQNFFVNSLSNVRVQVDPNTRVFVLNQFALRSPFLNASGTLQPILVGFGGSNLTVETAFNGTLVAPNASVTFGIGAGINFRGSFFAKDIEIRNNSTLTCDEGQTPPLPTNPTPSTCANSLKDGTETDVDCGGDMCAMCVNGLHCSANRDCQSNSCVNGTCQSPVGQVTASIRITADWGTGYCATLHVTNLGTLPTTNWSVSLNLSRSTTYTTWNGNFSGATATISVTPGFSWNRAIPAGATNQTVGFCSNRTPSNSGAVPIVVSASGTF